MFRKFVYFGPMKPLYILFLLFTAFSISASSQDTATTITNLKTGVFYEYPLNTNKHYRDTRNGNIETETNLENNDSSNWAITWQNDRTYTYKYLSSNDSAVKVQERLLKKHSIICTIDAIGSDYYIYTAHFDKLSNPPITHDTLWTHPFAMPRNKLLFAYIPGEDDLRKVHFRDTSHYAVVYLYRPGKLTNSLSDFFVYCNDHLLWSAHNNSGIIVAFFQEGPIKFGSAYMKDTSSVTVDVRFGHKYYVKAMMHWGMNSNGNFKLEMAEMKPNEGQGEFEEVKQR